MTEKKITVGIIQQQNTGDIADNKKRHEMAAELLLDLVVNGENSEKQKIMIEPELVEGTSCKRR